MARNGVKETEIDGEVLDVLASADIQHGNRVVLAAQLERDLYVRTDKVLKALGGYWDRKTRTHVFHGVSDLEDRFARMVHGGTFVDPRANGFFRTPFPLVERLMELAAIEDGMTVLEPSAGDGRLAVAAGEHTLGRLIVCCEILPENRARLLELDFRLLAYDFLSLSPLHRFDRVVMNPPWDHGEETVHLLHAWEMLKPGGRLAAVMPRGFDGKRDKRAVRAKELLERYGEVEENPSGSFVEEGTRVESVSLVLVKP